MVAITMIDKTPEPAIGSLQVTCPEVKENPNAIHSANDSPVPQYIPNDETWEPLLSARDNSDCQIGIVAIIPPVPRPMKMRPTMNWPKEYELPMSIAPINCTAAAMKIVRRRPRKSPRNVQANAPKTPHRVYIATTVPIPRYDHQSTYMQSFQRKLTRARHTLNRGPLVLLTRWCVRHVKGRELLAEGWHVENTAGAR